MIPSSQTVLRIGKFIISSLTIFAMAFMPFIGALSFPNFARAYALPEMLTDINQSGVGGDWFEEDGGTPVVYNGEMYFTSESESYDDYGSELWKSDGTSGGTVLVKDIWEGYRDSDPESLTVANGLLFFTAEDEDYGEELWKTDGTENGTVMVKDIDVGSDDSYPDAFTAFDNLLYFSAEPDGDGIDYIYSSDGTEASTTVAIDLTVLFPEESYIDVTFMGQTEDYMWFEANMDNMQVLIITDGTQGGTDVVVDESTDPVEDLTTDDDFGINENSIVFDGVLYFVNCRAAEGCELWKHQPENPAEIVKDFTEDSDASYFDKFSAINDEYFFFQTCPAGGDCEPWVSNGTLASTTLIEDIYEGSGDSYPNVLAAGEGNLFFQAYDENEVSRVYVTTGTTTSVVYQLGAGEDLDSESIVLDGVLYTSLCSDALGCELYRTTPGLNDLELVIDLREDGLSSFPEYLTLFEDGFLFQARSVEAGDELFFSDGTEGGTELVADMYEGTRGINGDGLFMYAADDLLYFKAYTDLYGDELWVTDGTEDGTRILNDIWEGTEGSYPSTNAEEFAQLNGYVYFIARDEDHGQELWRTDGTEEGTDMVKDIHTGGDAGPDFLTVMGDYVYFTAQDGSDGDELWRTDGTEEGTVLVKDIYEGGVSNPEDLAVYNGLLYFSATDDAGRELWKSDGTEEGTVMVVELTSGSDGASPEDLIVFNGELYFHTYTSEAHGSSVWKTDGTEEGTVFVVDADTENSFEDYSEFSVHNDRLYFVTSNGDNGEELWSHDGATTAMVKDINEGSSSSYPNELTSAGDYVYFAAYTDSDGEEVWRTDGTEEGTVMVKDVYDSDSNSSYPSSFVAAGDLIFFSASDIPHGRELWVSDGTEEGTEMVDDINELVFGDYPEDSYPEKLTAFNGSIFFYAEGPLYGEEVYVLGDAYIPNVDEEEPVPEEEDEPRRNGGRRNSGAGLSSSGNTVAQVVQTATGAAQAAGSVVFSRVLDLGANGNDVKELQKFLNSNGFVIALAGAGSPGNETNLFGTLTKAALARFQQTNGIVPAVGYFGPITKAFIENMVKGLTGSSAPASTPDSASAGAPTDRSVLELGMSGDDVLKLQNFLIAQNVGPASLALKANTATGYFGELTKSAVREWQQANGVTPATGNFGPLSKTVAQAKGF